ncbi:MAG: hydrogenase assembly protein HupF [Candidatus Aenigmatarchaeota archaeon]|nr:MAG: hydrogenase assembly protein HupF [Candidatus Aenigmarchaeota archaeon]RLJ07673.1 MAG: hydrogenase assembly protein HupF [Candidatus Aenigmarchaeota archaeon]
MCLSKPQKVLEVKGKRVLIEFEGAKKLVRSPFPVKKNDYVLCQNNIVVQKISKKTAMEMIREWKEMNQWIQKQK